MHNRNQNTGMLNYIISKFSLKFQHQFISLLNMEVRAPVVVVLPDYMIRNTDLCLCVHFLSMGFPSTNWTSFTTERACVLKISVSLSHYRED